MKSIYKTTPAGRLWIESKDFFNQPNVKSQIKKLIASDLFKSVNLRKERTQ